MNTSKLRGQTLGLLTMLGIQFILGIVLNLFVKLPENATLGSAIKHGGGVVLVLHILVAIGLLIGSLTLAFRSYAERSRSWIIASIIGALGVIAALTNGFAFVNNDNDVNSFVMALGFIVAASAYSTALAFAETLDANRVRKTERTKSSSGKYRHSHG
jgi:uncharacterized membrane protein YhaH (DUF805 family)